eukprot:TRINITY_DN368_c1_g1_i13.p1 TRINITY_DN368_c1_g1~~TRINITY_DN368_c1_g1_i13.p1  ORF type:complete len:217 (+),score=42.56 TRINITY_DN368_c1_g1_i13:287-937(+)
MSEDKSKTSVGTVVTQQGVPITPDSTKEEVATWLATLEGGRFARPGLEEATGADLYRMSENAFMTALGPVLGGSLYALLHPVQGTLNQLVSEVQTLKRQREEDKEQISRQEGLISQLTVELESIKPRRANMPSPRASIEEKENRESSLVRGHSTTTTLLTSTFPDPPPQPTMMAHILSDIDVEGPGSDTESPRQRQRRPQVKKNKKKKSTKGKQEK